MPLSARSLSSRWPRIAGVSLRLELRDPSCVASAFERRRQPNAHNGKSSFLRDRAFAEGEHIRVVMLARKTRDLFIPAKGASDPAHFVRRDRLAVTRAAKNNSTFAFSIRDCFRGRPNEERVIDRFITIRAEILHLMSELAEQFLYFLLVVEAGVIRPERDFHEQRL